MISRWVLVGLIFLGGCAEDEDLTRADVQLVALSSGEPPPAVLARLLRPGRRVLPAIEAALHVADEHGRQNLVRLLDRLADPEAAPLLRHFALYDGSPEVRRQAQGVLAGWAQGGDPGRAAPAREALGYIGKRRPAP